MRKLPSIIDATLRLPVPAPTAPRFLALAMAMLMLAGCVTMFAPIEWERREQVRQVINNDPLLSALYRRFDPEMRTLSGPGGFDEISQPFEDARYLSTYNVRSKVIYANREFTFTDAALRRILLHEFCHHIWNTGLDDAKRRQWNEYMQTKLSEPLQRLVMLYYPPAMRDVENFAFTVEFARKEDIKVLERLSIVSPPEASVILSRIPDAPKHDFWGMGMFDQARRSIPLRQRIEGLE
jgi:hypothetical protein